MLAKRATPVQQRRRSHQRKSTAYAYIIRSGEQPTVTSACALAKFVDQEQRGTGAVQKTLANLPHVNTESAFAANDNNKKKYMSVLFD